MVRTHIKKTIECVREERIVGAKKKNQATTKEELERDRQPCVKVIYDTLKEYVTENEENISVVLKHSWQLFLRLILILPSSLVAGSMSMATPVFGTITIETPLMIAAKNGVEEMVKEILKLFPLRIEDMNDDGKNIVLLAIEYRQTNVYSFLREQKWPNENLFWQVDKDGNNVLHLAARLGVDPDWLNPGEALSMSTEIKWFEYMKHSVPHGLLERYNREMKTPNDIFKESHKELMKTEGEWVAKTSQACSVVSTLVMSVAFAARDTVPGGYDSTGHAILRNKPPAFKYFSAFSVTALSFSLVSTICFLSTVVASPSQSVHSWKHVPIKLYFGMCSMFASIVSLWISFCGGYFFTLDDDSQKLSHALELYFVTSLLIIILVVSQIPTFIGPPLMSSTRAVPLPRLKATSPIEYRN
ncbi:ankyrin repeat-containing protein ITN1-like [Neltuma alba]|uniref:ankyrin repeat-containing protein ITN1-like n=1 Tax=Neltuma alba TaxID=207710 RepID=UPI0010A303FB|nr:ankyrin repeat-containing protein ITN1-like [Prosopis alba]